MKFTMTVCLRTLEEQNYIEIGSGYRYSLLRPEIVMESWGREQFAVHLRASKRPTTKEQ